MHNLKKVEKNFHDLIKNGFWEKHDSNFEFPTLTKDLLTKEEAIGVVRMPGVFFYFLKCEDGKYVLYVRACGPGIDELFKIDDNSYQWIKNGDYKKIRFENNIAPIPREGD